MPQSLATPGTGNFLRQTWVLISMIGTIGRLYLVTDLDINFAIKNVGLYKTSQNKEMAYYLFLYLKSPNGTQFIAENSEGSTQEYIALGSLRQMRIKFPPKALITRFNNLIEPMFNKTISNSNQIRILTTLRDTLLPKLISGELRVNM
ncbi:MAG: restriction endonuclease subunit S [Desulfitobacteriaceae bacterium]